MNTDAGPAAPAHEMTLEQWADLPEDELGELVDGRLEEEEVPNVAHEVTVSWLIHILRAWLAGRGVVLGSESKLAVAPRRGRKPDVLAYLPGDRLPGRHSSLHRRPPSIAVEVVTPTPRDARRDRVDKLGDYAGFGVRYYWILDPDVRSLEVFELGRDGRYVHALAASGGSVAPPGCEGLSLDLDALWAEIDALPEDDELATED